jgi:hypothetical protein
MLSAIAAVATWTETAGADGVRSHDGLYVRLGGGLGYLSDAAESENRPVLGRVEGTIAGVAGVTELAVGGSPTPGLVIGGGVFSAWVFSPTTSDTSWVTPLGTVRTEDFDFDTISFHVVGPLVDYYPAPSSGFHVQGAIGLGLLSAGDASGEQSGQSLIFSQTATGVGFMLGIGYEWWVADQWGIGALGRLTVAPMNGDDDNETEWKHTAFAPALLFTATFN